MYFFHENLEDYFPGEARRKKKTVWVVGSKAKNILKKFFRSSDWLLLTLGTQRCAEDISHCACSKDVSLQWTKGDENTEGRDTIRNCEIVTVTKKERNGGRREKKKKKGVSVKKKLHSWFSCSNLNVGTHLLGIQAFDTAFVLLISNYNVGASILVINQRHFSPVLIFGGLYKKIVVVFYKKTVWFQKKTFEIQK